MNSDRKKLLELNKNLAEVSERYTIRQNTGFKLYDSSMDEIVFQTVWIHDMELFINGLILGRETIR